MTDFFSGLGIGFGAGVLCCLYLYYEYKKLTLRKPTGYGKIVQRACKDAIEHQN